MDLQGRPIANISPLQEGKAEVIANEEGGQIMNPTTTLTSV